MSDSATTAAPAAFLPVRKGKIFEREGVKAVRLCIAAGNSVPTHAASVDVFAVVVRGRGRFVVEGRPIELEPGVVVEMLPNVAHSVEAREDLELVVLHCRLSGDATVALHCGA